MDFVQWFFNEAYQQGGWQGVVFAAVGVIVFLLGVVFVLILRAYAIRMNADSRQQNAESVAIEATVQLARDSSSSLQVAQELNRGLEKELRRLERELGKTQELMTASDRDYANCQVSLNQVKQLLANQGQQLMEANEAVLTQNLTIADLTRENEALKQKLKE